MQTLWQDLRYVDSIPGEEPGVRGSGDSCPGAGNRRQYRHLQRRERRAAPAASRMAIPSRLVIILHFGQDPVSPDDYLDWRKQSRSFEQMGAAQVWGADA